MIYWAPFLHFYQPPTQFHAILRKICDESYRPLVKMFGEHPSARVTINISAVLPELLDEHGGTDIIKGLKGLAENGQLEFADSAKFHPILPLIPREEARRQIELNRKTNEHFFGKSYRPRGFFPPEMAYSHDVAELLAEMGYEWLILSGVACSDTWPLDFISRIPAGKNGINVFFRDDIVSNKISFKNLDSRGFIKELAGFSKDKKDIYIVTAMDAETFGHHVHNWERLFLAEVYDMIDKFSYLEGQDSVKQKKDLAKAHKRLFSKAAGEGNISVVTMSELMDKFPSTQTREPHNSSWSTANDDIVNKNYYPLWKDPSNEVHKLQWEVMAISLGLSQAAFSVKNETDDTKNSARLTRGLLDRAEHSCPFWWANKYRGMWDINLINKGLLLHEEVILNAVRTIAASSMDEGQKNAHRANAARAREIIGRIRDIIVAV